MKKKPDTIVVCIGYTRKDIDNIVVQTLFEQMTNTFVGTKLEVYANTLQNLLNAKTNYFFTSDTTKDKIIIIGLNKISEEDCSKAVPHIVSKCFNESGRKFEKTLEITEKGAFEYETYETMEFIVPLTNADFQTYLV